MPITDSLRRQLDDELVTMSEAARDLGITREAIYRAKDDGRLEVEIVRGRLYVDRAEVERYRATPRGRGRPRVKAGDEQ